ncbi:serine/threonine protein kinase [bacterium]|nr:serine/threonine protein kinase [bacterium]
MTQPPDNNDYPFSPGSQASGQDPTVHHPPPPTTRSSSIPKIRPASHERIPKAGQTPQPTPTGDEQRVGPYILHRELARGGMGAVFLGEDPALRRKVAIKIMAKELLAEDDAEVRFEREGRAAASINHPNVAMIYMVGETETGAPFLAMEFIGGGTLSDIIRNRQRISFAAIADVMLQAAEGLRAAYREGIIHRDIKPGNIMMTDDGLVKVVDFGLAKFFNEDSFMTMQGTVLGTPRYMAPEQTQAREVDYRADVYSLGATFYHVLTGRPPFDGDSPTQIMMKHLTSPLVPLRSINPDVPMEFDEVIRRCMMKDPNDRYQDYADLISDLSRIKLQCTARERGSLVTSSSDLPTIRVGPEGQPLPPGASPENASAPGAASFSAPPRGSLTMDMEPEGAPVPPWRKALLIGAGAIVVLAIIVVISWPSPEPEQKPAGEKSGLATLIERLVEEQAGGGEPNVPQPDPNYLRYRATQEILEVLGIGLFTYHAEQGEKAPGLQELVESGVAVGDFDLSATGKPLDGWGRPFDYSRLQQKIYSAGLDGIISSDDDIEVNADGEISIIDQEPYDELLEAEKHRLESITGKSSRGGQ